MPHSEAELDFLESQIPELSAAATKIAYWKALSAGESVLESNNGLLWEVLPDGTRKVLKSLKARHPIAMGARIEIP